MSSSTEDVVASLAVFLDVVEAYDRVSATIVLSCLQEPGLPGRLIRFFRGYLEGCTFSIKLDASVRDPRPPKIGLPQGSVLTTVLFCVVMSCVVPVPTADYICVTSSIYANDICIWAASMISNQLVDAVQDVIDQLSLYLNKVGLQVSTHKARFLCLRALGAPRIPEIVQRSMAQSHLERCFPVSTRIYTDASIR